MTRIGEISKVKLDGHKSNFTEENKYIFFQKQANSMVQMVMHVFGRV
jgi:hypothetical protein